MQIVILDYNTLTVGDIDFSPFEKLGNVKYCDTLPYEKIVEECIDADIVVINKAKFTREIIYSLPKLKYIGLFATGYNNVNLEAASEKGIAVVNAPGYSTDSVAQLVFSFILELSTNLQKYDESVHRGEWIYSPTFAYFPYPISELAGKKLGIVGFGAIGKKVAKIADAFDMEVLVYTRTKSENCKYRYVSKEDLFSESDYISLNCPLNEGTENLVCKDTLSLMKKSAFIINTARGGVVDSVALTEALNSGMIAGAGIDTLVVEPMREDDPLYLAKNCIITPHIAWASIESRKRLIGMVAESIKLWQEGNPRFVVNNI